MRQGESGRPQTGPSLAVRPPPQQATTSPERVLLLHLVRELTKLQVSHPAMVQPHLRCSARHGCVQGSAKEVPHVLLASPELTCELESCGAVGMLCMPSHRLSRTPPLPVQHPQCLSAALQAPQPLDPDRVQSTLELAGLIVICSAPEPGRDSAPVTAVTMLVSLQQMLQALQMLHAARQALEYFQGECWGCQPAGSGCTHRRDRSGWVASLESPCASRSSVLHGASPAWDLHFLRGLHHPGLKPARQTLIPVVTVLPLPAGLSAQDGEGSESGARAEEATLHKAADACAACEVSLGGHVGLELAVLGLLQVSSAGCCPTSSGGLLQDASVCRQAAASSRVWDPAPARRCSLLLLAHVLVFAATPPLSDTCALRARCYLQLLAGRLVGATARTVHHELHAVSGCWHMCWSVLLCFPPGVTSTSRAGCSLWLLAHVLGCAALQNAYAAGLHRPCAVQLGLQISPLPFPSRGAN